MNRQRYFSTNLSNPASNILLASVFPASPLTVIGIERKLHLLKRYCMKVLHRVALFARNRLQYYLECVVSHSPSQMLSKSMEDLIVSPPFATRNFFSYTRRIIYKKLQLVRTFRTLIWNQSLKKHRLYRIGPIVPHGSILFSNNLLLCHWYDVHHFSHLFILNSRNIFHSFVKKNLRTFNFQPMFSLKKCELHIALS